jgi:hypothetical protein
LPIFCPSCKSISASKNYVFGGTFFHCWDNQESCPVCNTFGARLSEGLFNLAGEIAAVVTAPDITHAMLKAINATAAQVIENKITPEEGIAQAEIVSPKLASLVKKALGWGAAGLGYLLIAFELYMLSQQNAMRALRDPEVWGG